MNENTTHNSTNRLLALGIALTIGVWLVILFTGQQTEENPTTATATPPAQPEAKEKAKASGGLDAAAEFRERHNRALSPEAREDHRRKLWEQNFPFQPTFDPAVTVTADMISDEPESLTARRNHFDLKAFFESELRFSPQFEQLCRIMEECDRTENPLALAWAFETLREYHQARRENPDEVMLRSDGTPVMRRVYEIKTKSDGSQIKKPTDEWKPLTWGEHAEGLKPCILSRIDGRSHWPHTEPMSDEQADAVVERLINEIPGMADLDGYLAVQVIDHTKPDSNPLPHKTLKVGDPLLVPYVGYQAGFDAWNDERNRAINEGMAKKRRKNRPAGILADGTLVNASGEPIQAGAGSIGSFVNSGQAFALEETEDGHVRLSPEAMASLDEGLRNKTPPQNAHPPAFTEEESKRQETIIINAIEFRQE